jgi:hypothetical protein
MLKLILIMLAIYLAVIVALNLVPPGSQKLNDWVDILLAILTTIPVILLVLGGLYLLGTLILT